MTLQDRAVSFLRRTERYTKTDMVYIVQTGFWANLGTVTVTLGSFLLYVVFGHFVPKEVYGTYQYLLSVGAVVGAFTLTGMNAAVTRAVALGYEGALARATWLQLKWNLLPMAGAWAFGLYYLSQHDLTLGFGLLLIGIFVPLNNALNTYTAFLSGKKDFRRTFLFSLWWNVPYYLSVGVAAYFYDAALLLLAANLIAQAIGLAIGYYQTLRTYQPHAEAGSGTMRFGGHLSIIGLISGIVTRFDDILAFHFLGPANLAIYSFSTAIPDRISGLFKFLPGAAFPKFSAKSPAEIRASLGNRLWVGTGVVAVAALFYIAIAKPFFAFFFPAYMAAVPYSQAYALIIIISLAVSIISTALTAAKDMRALYVFNVSTSVVQLALQVAGILLYGLWGLIFGKIITYMFMAALGVFLYWRIEEDGARN